MSTDDSKPVDLSKPVQTRNGRKVKIYTTGGRHPTQPVIGEIYGGANCPPILTRWYADGSDDLEGPNDTDLINVPQQHTVTVNAYSQCGAELYFSAHHSRSNADSMNTENRIACFEHTFTEGEGLAPRTKDP